MNTELLMLHFIILWHVEMRLLFRKKGSLGPDRER